LTINQKTGKRKEQKRDAMGRKRQERPELLEGKSEAVGGRGIILKRAELAGQKALAPGSFGAVARSRTHLFPASHPGKFGGAIGRTVGGGHFYLASLSPWEVMSRVKGKAKIVHKKNLGAQTEALVACGGDYLIVDIKIRKILQVEIFVLGVRLGDRFQI